MIVWSFLAEASVAPSGLKAMLVTHARSPFVKVRGRAGRKERIALINAFALARAHDTYFFERPADMISGEIEPPDFSIDNERILRRQINSLILEKLDFQFHRTFGEHFPEGEEAFTSASAFMRINLSTSCSIRV